ncbi:MAG TPA: ABC transporter permease, partial [Euzebya sp.]|nr:ABC transporter permease [Euzebya sp.]
MNTRIRKSLRDLGLNRPRTALLVASVAVGVAAAGGVLGAFDVIDREIDASFASTSPADAILTLDGDARPWVDTALEIPGVVAAEPRVEVLARMEEQPGWQRVTLVAVDDFDDVGVGAFFTDSGAAAPGRGEVLVERASLTEVDLAVGDPLAVSAPGQPARDLTVVGLAHDPGRTPAWMFGNVVAYVTGQTLVDLGYADALPSLLIRGDGAPSREANRLLADDVAAHLQSAGATVTSIQTPVPGEHPASGVMATLVYLLQAFGLITLVASVAL